MDGRCCRVYWVPVTHLDVFRIVYYGDLKPRGFLRLHVDASSNTPSIKIKGREYYLALKRSVNRCVFLLDNGKCSIHEFKPLTCRFYPFVYITRNGKAVDIDVCSKALGSCPGLVMDRAPINKDLKEKLLAVANVRITEIKLYREAIHRLLAEFNGKPSFEDAVEFLLDEARRDYYKLKEAKLWVK